MTESIENLSLLQFTAKLKKKLDKGLIIGDLWYPIDLNWLLKCKKYIGFDGDGEAGDSKFNPGPIDNTDLLKDDDSGDIKNGMKKGFDFELLHKEAWDMMVARFTVVQNSRHQTTGRKVIRVNATNPPRIELHVKKYKLVDYSNPDVYVVKKLSEANTVASLEKLMRIEFNIDSGAKTRIYSSNHDLLDKPQNTIYQCYLSDNSIIIQQMKEDGTWPSRHQRTSKTNQSTEQAEVVGESDQARGEHQYISANDVNVDLEQTNQELLEKVRSKIDHLNDRHRQRDVLDTTEKEDLEKRHQENLKAITLKKEVEIAKLINQERAEIETENSIFKTEKENLETNQKAIRAAIVCAISELSMKLDKINGTEVREEQNTELKKAMECPVCLDQMKPPTRIFQCTSGHLLCEDCKYRMNGGKCPTCKKAQLMGRATAVEQMARTLYGGQ